MSDNQSISDKGPSKSPEKSFAGQDALQILMKEYETLFQLYTHTQTRLDATFNFYLTLVTAIVGVTVALNQFIPPASATPAQSRLILAALMLFASAVSSMYLASITSRYADAKRYAEGLDSLRRHLLGKLDLPLPSLYAPFLHPQPPLESAPSYRSPNFLNWLLPTGSYQFFIVAITSVTLTIAVYLVILTAGITISQPFRSAVSVLVVFVLTFVLSNLFSHLMLRLRVAGLRIGVYSERDYSGSSLILGVGRSSKDVRSPTISDHADS